MRPTLRPTIRPPAGQRLWLGYLALAGLAVGIFDVAPAGVAKTALYLAVVLSGALAVAAGARLGRARPAAAWYLLASGLLAFFAGDLVWRVYHLSTGRAVPSSWTPDVPYLIGYLLLVLGALHLMRTLRNGRSVEALLDAAVVASGLNMLLWEPLLNPNRANHEATAFGRAVLLAYPGAAVMILVVLSRLFGTRSWKNGSLLLMTAGFTALLVSSVLYGCPIHETALGFSSSVAPNAGWLAAYVLLGAAALHPSARAIHPGTDTEPTPFRMRSLALVAVAAALFPGMLVYQLLRDSPVEPSQVSFSVVLIGLVMLRFAQGIRTVERAGAALAASEARFRALAEQSFESIAILEPDLTLRYVSPSVQAVSGYSAEELVGLSVLDLVHPDDVEDALEVFAAGMREPRASATVEYRLRHKDGSWRIVESVGQNLLDDPDIHGILTTTRDVTDRRRAEDALRASEERFRLLAEHAQDVIFRRAVGPEGAFEYVSPAILPMTGYTPEELCSDPDILRKLVHPEDVPIVAAAARDVEVAAPAPVVRFRWLRKDGETIWVETRLAPILDEAGTSVAVLGIVRDVTDRRQAEDAIRESEERFRLLAANARDVIFRRPLEIDRPFEYVSPAILAMTGYTPEELCSDPGILRKLTHPDDLPLILEARDSASFEPMDVRWIAKDGRVIWTEGRGRIVFDEAGRPAAVEGIVRDVTELRAAEAERERLLAAEQAARRDTEDAYTLINEQNQLLQEADRLKDELISVISHDLRTPLTSIMGYLKIVLDEEVGHLEEQQRHFLTVVQRNADRLLVLIDDLLFISRVEAGKLDLALEEIDLAQVAADAVEAQQPKAQQVGVSLGLVAEPVSPVTADRARIAEVIENLLSNALKFTSSGGSVEVRVRAVGGKAVLEVSDTGVGIATADQKHLFERFFRSARTRAVPGIGLGLAIVRAIVNAHHGRVTVKSKAGQGTTFRVELPLVQHAASSPTHGRANTVVVE